MHVRVQEGSRKSRENPKGVLRPGGSCAIFMRSDEAWRSDRAEEKGGLGLWVAGVMWEVTRLIVMVVEFHRQKPSGVARGHPTPSRSKDTPPVGTESHGAPCPRCDPASIKDIPVGLVRIAVSRAHR